MTEPKITAKGNKIFIEAEIIGEGEESESKKTMVFCSTHGSKKVKTDMGEFSVGLNIFKKK